VDPVSVTVYVPGVTFPIQATVELPGTPALQFPAVLHVPPDALSQLSVQAGNAALGVAVTTATTPTELNDAMATAAATAAFRTLDI
jgi:hypothetical protein